MISQPVRFDQRRTPLSRRRLLLAASALLPAACGVPGPRPQFVTPPAGEIPIAPVRVGQRWRYQEINVYNGARSAEISAQVVETAPRLRVRLTRSDGRAQDDEIYSAPWNVVQEPFYDITQTFEQPLPLLPPQLSVGAQLSRSLRYRSTGASRRLYWGDWLVARGWEQLRLPAGEFLALRIERLINFEHQDIFRQEPRRYDTLWYAPSAGRWVQREWTGEYFMPGGRRRTPMREDWIRWELVEYAA